MMNTVYSISVETMIFFMIIWLIESSNEQHLSEIEIFYET